MLIINRSSLKSKIKQEKKGKEITVERTTIYLNKKD